MAGPVKSRSRRGGDGNAVMLLSLKIILLAFFIFLNAMSDFEIERTDKALASIQQTFRGEVSSISHGAHSSAARHTLPATNRALRRLGEEAARTLPLTRWAADPRRRKLVLSLPAEALFRPASAELRAPARDRLRHVARLLRSERRRGQDFDLALLHGHTTTLLPAARRGTTALDVETRRVSRLARLFAKTGLDPARLAVGLVAGAPGELRLVVTLVAGSAGRLR
jgi:flagellar motor protein MotB